MKSQNIDAALAGKLGAPDGYAAIARACAYILTETAQSKPPIRLKPILNRLGIRIVYHEGEERRGNEIASLILRKGELLLAIERMALRANSRRARFSIAHEIGHALILRVLGGDGLDLAERSVSAYEKTEALCDFAASSILLPRSMLHQALRARSISKTAFDEMRSLFDVSEEALLRGVAGLVSEGAILELRQFRRSATEVLAWRVYRTYVPKNQVTERPWLPVGCTLKHIDSELPLADFRSEVPLFVGRVTLSLGKRRTHHDGIACSWQHSHLQDRLFEAEQQNRTAARSRTMLLLGKRNFLDASLFVGGSPDESLHIGSSAGVPKSAAGA